MVEEVSTHYGSGGDLAEKIAEGLRNAGKDLNELKAFDLSAVDEFHFRGRNATLQLAEEMKLSEDASVLDIGSGLGGPARTLAEEYGCNVIGLDLTQAFCEVAGILSGWVNLAEWTEFQQGDATNLPFAENQFDAAMTIHVAMNVPVKDKMYQEVRRVIKPGGVFAIYDILQGEGGEILFPVPWARNSTISHLATPDEMTILLSDAAFNILDVHDSTHESLSWLEARTTHMAQSGPSPVITQILFGSDFPEMISNQIRNLTERKIRTVSYICEV
jgi:ubiquinone/menaquinone biosynthesis C-methylase UbiE